MSYGGQRAMDSHCRIRFSRRICLIPGRQFTSVSAAQIVFSHCHWGFSESRSPNQLNVRPDAFFRFDREEKDEKTVRRKIDILLKGANPEKLVQAYRVLEVLLEP
jgi:hypothetical protein